MRCLPNFEALLDSSLGIPFCTFNIGHLANIGSHREKALIFLHPKSDTNNALNLQILLPALGLF